MRKRRHAPEQIVRKLREADKLLAEGSSLVEVLQTVEVMQNTYYRWRRQYSGMSPDEAKRLKELELENARWKKLVADQALDITCAKR